MQFLTELCAILPQHFIRREDPGILPGIGAHRDSVKSSFLDLLDSERIYLNAKLSEVQFLAEALKAYANLSWATGLDLSDTKTELQP